MYPTIEIARRRCSFAEDRCLATRVRLGDFDGLQRMTSRVFWKKISAEDIKAQIDVVPTVFETTSEQKNDLPRVLGILNFVRSPKKKKRIHEFFDAKGKQILDELAGEATSISDFEPLNTIGPTTAP